MIKRMKKKKLKISVINMVLPVIDRIMGLFDNRKIDSLWN